MIHILLYSDIIGPRLLYAVPKTRWGSNIPLPRQPLGYGHLYLLPYTDGYITQITQNIEIELSSGILSLLGIVSKPGKLIAGWHIGDKIIDFAKPKDLRIYLDQINTATNYVDGAPSTLLEIIPVFAKPFGKVVSHRFKLPIFKKLANGCITEL